MSLNVKSFSKVLDLLFSVETVNVDAVLLPDAVIFEVGDEVVAEVGRNVVNGVVAEVDYADPQCTWVFVRYAVNVYGVVIEDATWLAVGSIAHRDEFENGVA